MEMLLIVGAISAINLIVLKLKIDQGKYLNALIDFGAYALLVAYSGGTLGGLIMATSASLLISIFLLISPPKLRDVK